MPLYQHQWRGPILCLTGVHQLGEIDVSAVRIIPLGTVCICTFALDMITGNTRCRSVLRVGGRAGRVKFSFLPVDRPAKQI